MRGMNEQCVCNIQKSLGVAVKGDTEKPRGGSQVEDRKKRGEGWES